AALSNVGEVLKHNSCAIRGMLNDTPGKDMITVPVEKGLPLAQLFQVTFGRLRSFGLQLSTHAEVTAINFFPVRITEELMLRGDSRMSKPKVYTYDQGGLFNVRFFDADHDVQPPFAFAITQIGGSNWIACVVLAEMRNGERDCLLTLRSGKTDRLCFPCQRV